MDTNAKTIRFPADLAERLRAAAFIHRRHQNEIVVTALADYLDRLDATGNDEGNS